MFRRTLWSCFFPAASLLLPVVVSCASPGRQPQNVSAVGKEFGYYVRVVEGLWIRPLGLDGRELSLRTDFYMPEGLHTVLIDVLGDVDCNTGRQPQILETQLMLAKGVNVSGYTFREPGGEKVGADAIEKRIASVLAFAKDEWGVSPSGPVSLARGPGETWRRIPLKGPRLTGSALFDTATGRLAGLDLSPSQ